MHNLSPAATRALEARRFSAASPAGLLPDPAKLARDADAIREADRVEAARDLERRLLLRKILRAAEKAEGRRPRSLV